MTDIILDTANALMERFMRQTVKPMRAINGTRRIGEGSYRTVFSQPSTGLVYKIGETRENTREFVNYRRLVRDNLVSFEINNFLVKVPVTDEIIKNKDYSIITMNRVKGRVTNCEAFVGYEDDCNCRRKYCFSKLHEAVSNVTGISDVHGENLLLDRDGTYWLIDLQM